MPTVSWIRNQN